MLVTVTHTQVRIKEYKKIKANILYSRLISAYTHLLLMGCKLPVSTLSQSNFDTKGALRVSLRVAGFVLRIFGIIYTPPFPSPRSIKNEWLAPILIFNNDNLPIRSLLCLRSSWTGVYIQTHEFDRHRGIWLILCAYPYYTQTRRVDAQAGN